MHFLEEVEQAARAPRLSVARIRAVLAILVRQLRDASPRVLLDVLARLEKDAVEVVQSLSGVLGSDQYIRIPSSSGTTHRFARTDLGVEVQVCAQEVAQRPSPLRSLCVRVSIKSNKRSRTTTRTLW